MINLGGLGFFGGVAGVDQGLLRDVQLFLAVAADAADKTLRANQVNGSGHEKWFDAHVHQTADGRGRVIGVQRGEHQVARKRGLDSNFCRFKVANLSDQNNIRILPQEGTERGGKVQADLLLHLHLVDARQLKLDGVFRGHDVGVHGIQSGDRGIQSIGFARTRWTGNQHHAVGLQDVPLKFFQRLRLEAELGHVQPEVFLVQQSHDDFFAVKGRHSRNAEVQFLLFAVGLVLDHDTAVLRQALFRNVQLGHDLQAAGDGILQAQGWGHDRGELAVNAEPHAHLQFVGLDVNIARSALDGVRQDQVDQLDDGSFLSRFLQRRSIQLRFFGGQLELVVFINEVLHQIADLFLVVGRSAVEAYDRVADCRFGGHHWLDVETRHELDVVHGEDVGGIRHGDSEDGTHARKWDDLVARGGVLGNQFDNIGIDFVILQVDGRNAVLTREHAGDVIIGDEAHFGQAASQLASIGALKLQRFLELVLRDQAFFN